MSNCIFTIGSVTKAMKSLRVLNEYSIPASTVKLSSDRGKGGCIYGLEFNCMHAGNVSRLLKLSNIRYEENS